MTQTLGQSTRQAVLTALSTAYGAAAQIVIGGGTMPTDCDTAFASNSVIVALPMTATTPFGAPTAAKPSVMTAAAITAVNAYSSTTATFFRSYAQGTSGITGSSFVVGNMYMVQAIGSSTLANFQSIGLNASIATLAVGQMFIATATTLTGSGTAYLMNPIEQGTVGTSGADLNLNTTSIVAGGPVSITLFTRSY